MVVDVLVVVVVVVVFNCTVESVGGILLAVCLSRFLASPKLLR